MRGFQRISMSLQLQADWSWQFMVAIQCGNPGKIAASDTARLGEFFLGSDAITHSYQFQTRKQWLIQQVPQEAEELFKTGSTIGAYILFPNRRIEGKQTINQARGVNRLIDDRFDLTLECIRRYYLGIKSPLYDTILWYKSFFDLFQDFDRYTRFFLLEDLVDENGNVQFHLPFDGFTTPPTFRHTDDKSGV